MTPHISAAPGEIAKVVLMPGDPLRARYMAETYLVGAKLVSAIRGMEFWTGTYKGHPITIGGSGMGMPSIAIYSYELYKFYDVDWIIRTGTCGAYYEQHRVMDIVIAQSAFCYATDIALLLDGSNQDRYTSSPLILAALETASKGQARMANIHSTNVFYNKHKSIEQLRAETQGEVVEMEAYGLFAVAHHCNRHAGAILTVSDNLVDGAEVSAERREQGVGNMFQIALEAAIEYYRRRG